jgi:hypothetical protein
MNYERYWIVLEELMVELRQKGINIPQATADDLMSARTLITIHNTDPSVSTVEAEISLYLEKVEPILLSLAEFELGKDYADAWQAKTTEAITQIEEKTAFKSRYVTGVVRGEGWLRIKTAGIISDVEVAVLLKQLNLSAKPQDDGYLLVQGDKDSIKTFVREIRKKVGKGKLD